MLSGSDELIDFGDVNKGYETFVVLFEKMSNWKRIAKIGIDAYVIIHMDTRVSMKRQLVFSISPSQVMENGQQANAFGIYAGIFEGLRAVFNQAQQAYPSINLCMPIIAMVDDKLVFMIMPK